MKDYTGEVLDGKYRLSRLLGKGGMGAVYQGQHVVIGKTVAVKFLHAEFAANKEVVKRFYREAQAAAAIGHDSIINVMDVGVSREGEPYLVMEYLEGESLASLMRRQGVFAVPAACGIMEPMLRALNAAHAKGIIHRDLKPENIFLAHRPNGAPRVKLIDFGISKITRGQDGEKLTQTGSVIGTPAYMSPEQARGSTELDHRADLYSAGVILYELLTGELPFEGNNFTECILNILTQNPTPPLEACADFPREMEPIVLRALVKNPDGRYQSALDFLKNLQSLPNFHQREAQLTHFTAGLAETTFAGGDLGESITGDESVAADALSEIVNDPEFTPTGWTETGPHYKKKRSKAPLVAFILTLFVALGGLGTYWYLQQYQRQPLVIPTVATPKAPVQTPSAPTPPPEPPRPVAPEPPRSVEISVKGVPDGALIRYNGVLVTDNPFRVPVGEQAVPLQIEAAGYISRLISLIPTEDRILAVDLEKEAPRKPPPKPSREKSKRSRPVERVKPQAVAPLPPKATKVELPTAPEPKEPSPPASSGAQFKGVVLPKPSPEPKDEKEPAAKSTKPKLKKGARGTKIQTSFE